MCLKGSESKLMLSKLKSQLEELRSKVVFLDSVKKYLEVMMKLYFSLGTPLCCLLFISQQHQSYGMFSFISADSECGPVGFGGFITAIVGCLWSRLFGAPIL